MKEKYYALEFTTNLQDLECPVNSIQSLLDNSLSDWLIIPDAAGGNRQTLSMKMTDSDRSGNVRYRCIVTDSQGWTVTSNEVRPIFPLAIIKQPINDHTANVGDKAEFSLEVL